MSVIIDVLIAAIIISCVIRHYKLGLACSLLSFGKFIIAFICAGIFRAPFASLGLRIFAKFEQYNTVQNEIAGVIAYIFIFAAVIILSNIIIKKFSNLRIPVVTKFDKLLGVALGLISGLFFASFISTVAYAAIKIMWSVTESEWIMNIYSSSYLFKFIKDISLFEFIRSKIRY